jgi:hypothetical protein
LSASIVGLLVFGCAKPSKEISAFADKMAAADERLYEGGKQFGETVGPALKGNVGDIKKSRLALEHNTKLVNEALAEHKALKIPKAPKAQEFYDAQQEFLVSQEKLIKEDFTKVVQILEDEKIAGPEKQKQILGILTKVEKESDGPLKKILEAQRAFAAANGIRLLPAAKD